MHFFKLDHYSRPASLLEIAQRGYREASTESTRNSTTYWKFSVASLKLQSPPYWSWLAFFSLTQCDNTHKEHRPSALEYRKRPAQGQYYRSGESIDDQAVVRYVI